MPEHMLMANVEIITDGGRRRPTGIAVLPDGNLLVSDDAGGTIYRVTHDRGK